jgi:ABC-2 type transport system permease protein
MTELKNTVMLVAGREFRQRVRGRAFRVATVLVLLGVGAAIVIPKVASGKPPAPQQVGIVGSLTGAQRAAVLRAAHDAGVDMTLHRIADRTAADHAVGSGRLDLAISDAMALIVAHTISASDTSDTASLAHSLASVLGAQAAIARAGLTPSQVTELYASRPVPIIALHHEHARHPVDQAASTIALIALFIMLSQYLTWTLVGVMEEKSSRVVEVLLATLRPVQLLTGKLIGIGATVFLQAALVATVGLALAGAVGSEVLHGASPLVLGSTLLWLFLGYAFLSWVYAAAGSLVERQDQVQSLAIPLVIPLVVGYVSALSAIGAGHPSQFVTVLAYLPPTAPFAMPALVGLRAVTWWQFTLSVLITISSTVVTARFAATVYRRAVLRTGGRVRLRDVIGSRRFGSSPS